MKIETREIYKCEHCNKLYQIKRYCEAHEKICIQNPDNNRACYNCSHLIKQRTTHYYDAYDGEHSEEVNILFCTKLEIYLYPPKVEHKKNWYELGDELNEPMKRECKHQNKTMYYD